ncbi:amidohydrolase family protein [Nakamurella sp. YIM 132087]|uniref:Amidohydrolase family protein n=1 Tax=Nakamurella alba TaxID=2665158 RepID=A0A7K1FSC2_9ACTN|nr:amidohydrolase [Nakamurella alba]MTD17047.1 amidohydrolase family protein [Nakamurella alba]
MRVVRGGDVLDVPVDGPVTVLPARDVWIDGDRIEAVLPTGERPADGHEVVEAAGLLVMPGLVNGHTHSPMVLMRGAAEDVSVEDWFNKRVWPMEVNLNRERVRTGALLAATEMLLGGVTTFADHYFHADAIAEAAVQAGIRAVIAPTFFSEGGPTPMPEAIETARAINGLGGLITGNLGPHSAYTVSESDLTATAAIAAAEGLRIHLHASENIQQTRSSLDRLGVTPIEVLRRTGVLDAGALIAHGCGIVPEDAEALAAHASRTGVASCPKVYLKHALAPVTPIPLLQRCGVAVGAGTDGAAGHTTLDVWESLRLVAMTQKYQEADGTYLTCGETLRLATRGGATAVGLGHEIGAIEPGLKADLALVDLTGLHLQPVHDPLAALVYAVGPRDVHTVIVNGRTVVADHRPVTVDTDRLRSDVAAVATALVDTSHGRSVQHYAP